MLHYAQEIFEGLKAYRRDDGGVNLFRPDANARRFRNSADRMAMAPVPEAVFIEAVEQLVQIDRAWIPGGEGSLYLRPFMIANEVFLGVKPSSEYIFAVIASPVGSYFKGGPAPVSIWVSENYTRAAVGGTGAVKCGGNYAASLRAQAEAIERGCDQVVFLDAIEHRYVEELGGMNVFFVFDDGSLSTPPLGTILPGITRDSIIALAREAGKTVREETYSIDQWRADAASGKLRKPSPAARRRSSRRSARCAPRMATSPSTAAPPVKWRWGCARSWWTSSTAAPPTRTTGSRRSCNRARSMIPKAGTGFRTGSCFPRIRPPPSSPTRASFHPARDRRSRERISARLSLDAFRRREPETITWAFHSTPSTV